MSQKPSMDQASCGNDSTSTSTTYDDNMTHEEKISQLEHTIQYLSFRYDKSNPCNQCSTREEQISQLERTVQSLSKRLEESQKHREEMITLEEHTFEVLTKRLEESQRDYEEEVRQHKSIIEDYSKMLEVADIHREDLFKRLKESQMACKKLQRKIDRKNRPKGGVKKRDAKK